MIEPGRVIGAYRVEAHVGAGGMADVYRVRHVALGSQHALKVLRQELAVHEDVRARFLAEGRVQAQVRHPHVALVTDLVAEPGVAGLVLEWLDGGSLEDRLLAMPGRPLDLPRVLGVLLPILDALDLLHRRGIVHRDLKPANLVFRDAGWDRPVLTDFGVARVTEEALLGARSRPTQAGTRLGTPHYMSPEQVQGLEVDARADVYSVGVVAWELLTGGVPFDGPTDFAIMQRVVEGARPRLVEVRPELPAGLADAVERALAVDPAARFEGAAALAEALQRGGAPPSDPRPPEVAVDPAAAAADVELDALEEPPPARRRGRGCWRLGCLLVVLFLGLVGALVGLAVAVGIPELERTSRAGVETAWEELRVYKTDPDANRDLSHLARASMRADEAVGVWPTPEALGMVALVDALGQRWHWAAAAGDPGAQARIADAIRRAEVAGGSAEAATARVWLELAACRLEADPTTRGWACNRLRDAADAAVRQLWDRPWMAVEVDWVAALGTREQLAPIVGVEALPGPLLADAVARCERGLARVDEAPVNGRFLALSCAVLAGWAGDRVRYLTWSDLAVRLTRAAGQWDADVRATLYRAADPRCERAVSVGRGGAPVARDAGTGGWGDLCLFLGRVAEGCDEPARALRPTRCAGWWTSYACEPIAQAGVPWAEAVAAADATAGARSAVCRP